MTWVGGAARLGDNPHVVRRATFPARDAVMPAFGADTTVGVANWNDATNTKPGFGPTLLVGSDTNGPSGSGAAAGYYHVLNIEYATKDGTGNITQLAIPYGNDISPGIWMRGRYSGSWTTWRGVEARTVWNALSGGYYTPGFADYGGGWLGGRFQKQGDRCKVTGMMLTPAGSTTAPGTTIFTLPAGYRPVGHVMASCQTSAGVAARVDFYSTGIVQYIGGGTLPVSSWIFFDVEYPVV